MLSDLLNSYAMHFAEWARAGGARMDARVCALMHTNLMEAADQARRIEGQPVPPATRALPPGVADLDLVRSHRLSGGLPSGGSAA
jgi:hypothetical protein